jgi:hypothetical protein
MDTSSDLAYTEEDAVVNEFDSLSFKRTKEMEEEYIRIQIRTREKLSPDDYQKLAYLSRVLGSEKVTRLDQLMDREQVAQSTRWTKSNAKTWRTTPAVATIT